MTRRLFALIGILAAMAWPLAAHGDITTYTQDFEGLALAGSPNSSTALSGDGWKVGANVFAPDGTFLYNYFAFPAPNGGAGFSAVATGAAGSGQGANYLNIYSDYNNADHGNGNYIDALVFRDQTIGAGDVGAGKSFSFTFDYLRNPDVVNGAGDTRTFAFVKVLQQSNGSFALLGQAEFETTNASTSTWATHTMQLAATNSAWAGELVQIGFRSYATNYRDSGRFYDNLKFSAVPEPSSLGVISIGLLGLIFRRRRVG